MTRTDMLSSPKAIKQEQVKEVIVPCYSYQKNDKEESLISENVTVKSGDVVTYYLGEAAYGYVASLSTIVEGGEGTKVEGISITESGAYFVTVKYSVEGSYRMEITGHRYVIVEKYALNSLNVRGKTIKWENPLISDMTVATDLATWIGDYYKSGIEYEYDYRGYPEQDVNDIIYQDNEFHNNMKVNVYRNTLTFDGAFGGKITARRQEG